MLGWLLSINQLNHAPLTHLVYLKVKITKWVTHFLQHAYIKKCIFRKNTKKTYNTIYIPINALHVEINKQLRVQRSATLLIETKKTDSRSVLHKVLCLPSVRHASWLPSRVHTA